MNTTSASFDLDKARFNMIEQQIRPWMVLDKHVLDLLGDVKREQFVPPAYRGVALADLTIPLTAQGTQGPCMLNPKVEARMVQDLALQPEDTVLEIGTGSGYMAALMSRLCARVTTVEIDPALAKQARANLQQAGIDNVDVKEADATANRFAACTVGAPFDAIVLSGSVAEIPGDLLELLKTGGRLLAIVGDAPAMRATLVRRTGPTTFHTEQPWDTVVPRLQHFPEPTRFRF
ncbi:MAG TPA: protein-L-isoaspartate O-methyltransferase [Macromonas sp.]|nr:protein-L-isoaspartate O-methyltransferase [Macromonas sp.]